MDCPEWLGHDLLAGALPWGQATPGSLSGFLERYTLRHARWVGLYLEPVRAATLLLRWNGGPEAEDLRGTILAIRFDALERSEVKLRERDIASAVSGPTSRAADVFRTHLVDRQGGDAMLLHSPGVRLLCMTPARQALPILVPAETI